MACFCLCLQGFVQILREEQAPPLPIAIILATKKCDKSHLNTPCPSLLRGNRLPLASAIGEAVPQGLMRCTIAFDYNLSFIKKRANTSSTISDGPPSPIKRGRLMLKSFYRKFLLYKKLNLARFSFFVFFPIRNIRAMRKASAPFPRATYLPLRFLR